MFKNTASQKVAVRAYTSADGLTAPGDAAQITSAISKDGAAAAATDDVNPTEIAGGLYVFDMTQAETNADLVSLTPVSSTSGVVLDPVDIYTVTPMRGTDDAALASAVAALNDFDPAADTVARVTLVDTTTANTDMVAAAPTVGEIDDELTANHGTGSWQESSGTPGVGALTITVLDQYSAPVVGATMKLTDTAGSGNDFGNRATNANGVAIIDASALGNYTLTGGGVSDYTIPDTAVTISAGATSVSVTAQKSSANAPTDPTLGTLYGDTVKITGTAAVGVEVLAKKTSADVVYVDGNAVTKYERKTITDSDGRFEFELLLNVELTITIAQLDYEEDITLTEPTTALEDAT